MSNNIDSNSSLNNNTEFMQAYEKLAQNMERAKITGLEGPEEIIGQSLYDDIRFTQAAEELIDRIEAAETKDLFGLAKIAGLDLYRDFAGGDLRNVNLSHADLNHADLSHADLSHADLRYTNLSHANLNHANLNHANLNHANLSHASLLHTDFSHVDLSDVTVEKARFGWNRGLSETQQIELARIGARWEERIRRALSIWEEFADSDRDWIIAHGDNQFLTVGDILIHQGKPIDTISIVLEGEIDVLVEMANGLKDRKIATIFPSEMVGEMSFVKDRPPSATLIAKQDTLVWSIPRAKLLEKLAQDSDFGYRFHQAISAVLAHRLMLTTLKLLNEETADNDDPFIAASAKLAIGGMVELQEGKLAPVEDMDASVLRPS